MTIKQRMDKALEMAGQTKGAEISQGALKSTPVLFKKFFPGQKAVVITDHFVWTAAGEAVYNIMNAEGVECEKFVIPDKSFHAEWKYVEMIEEVMILLCCRTKVFSVLSMVLPMTMDVQNRLV